MCITSNQLSVWIRREPLDLLNLTLFTSEILQIQRFINDLMNWAKSLKLTQSEGFSIIKIYEIILRSLHQCWSRWSRLKAITTQTLKPLPFLASSVTKAATVNSAPPMNKKMEPISKRRQTPTAHVTDPTATLIPVVKRKPSRTQLARMGEWASCEMYTANWLKTVCLYYSLMLRAIIHL